VITLSSTVEEARRALAMTDQRAVVVWNEATPVGVVTPDDVIAIGVGHPSPEALVEDVMSHECVPIDPAADEPETCHRYIDAAWASLKRRRPLSDETLERRAWAMGPSG
jgi:predicted transcriptional regulator